MLYVAIPSRSTDTLLVLYCSPLNRKRDLTDKWSRHEQYERTKAAIFEYGWPDNFRTDDFRRDIDGLQQKWHHECTAQMRERLARDNLEEMTKNVTISETDQ